MRVRLFIQVNDSDLEQLVQAELTDRETMLTDVAHIFRELASQFEVNAELKAIVDKA